MRKNLTDRFVRFAPIPDEQTDYWDTSIKGFGLRVSPRGKKTFQIMFRHDGRQRRMALAQFPILSLKDARKLAKDKLADVAKGDDPAAKRSANRNAETFQQLTSAYPIRHLSMRIGLPRVQHGLQGHDPLRPRHKHGLTMLGVLTP